MEAWFVLVPPARLLALPKQHLAWLLRVMAQVSRNKDYAVKTDAAWSVLKSITAALFAAGAYPEEEAKAWIDLCVRRKSTEDLLDFFKLCQQFWPEEVGDAGIAVYDALLKMGNEASLRQLSALKQQSASAG